MKFKSILTQTTPATEEALNYYMLKQLQKSCDCNFGKLRDYFTSIFESLINRSQNEDEFYNNLANAVAKFIGNNHFENSKHKCSSYEERIKLMLNGCPLSANPVYLDIGCGDGVITKSIGESLYIDKNNIFGIDISNPASIEGVNILKYDGKNIPRQIPPIDFATLFMVLHHLKNEKQAKYLLKSIYKRMNDGGYLLIRDHEIKNKQDKLFWKIIHPLNSKIMGGPYPDLDYGKLYLSSEKWEKILQDIGFKVVKKVTDRRYNNQCSYLLLVQKSP